MMPILFLMDSIITKRTRKPIIRMQSRRKNRNEKLNVSHNISQKNNSRKKCEAKKKIIIIRHVMTRDKTRKWFATKNMKWSNRIFSLNINRKCRKWFWLSFIFIDSFHCNVCRLLFIFSFMIHLFIYPTNQSSIHVEYSVAIIFFLLFSSSYRLNLSMSYCLLEIKIQETKGFSLKYNNRWWVDGWWFGMRQSDLISSNLRINNQWFWFTNTDYEKCFKWISVVWYWVLLLISIIHVIQWSAFFLVWFSGQQTISQNNNSDDNVWRIFLFHFTYHFLNWNFCKKILSFFHASMNNRKQIEKQRKCC